MKKSKHVIVIGAGLAGLAAARTLKQHGISVKILEARNRIGGRTHTDYSFSAPFDHGAFIIHGLTQNPIAELAKLYHAKHVPIELDSVNFINQQRFTSEELQRIHDQYHLVLERASQIALRAPQDMPLSEAVKIALTQHHYPDLTPELCTWKALFLSLYTGADIHKLSARYWDLEVKLDGGNHIMLNGYQPIVSGLAEGLDIELDAKVNDIHYEKNIKIKTHHKTYTADAVLVTAPLGVLKSHQIAFHPELPHFKQEAINKLGMGLLNKMMLEFPHTFWPADGIFSYFTDHYSTFAWFNNFEHYFHKPILLAALGGEIAAKIENLSNQEAEQEAMRVLRDLFGNNIPNPTRSLLTRWQHDPFSLGSYSYLPIGTNGNLYDLMAQPIADKLFFAGEATHSEYPATTHGAYLSGVREAERIIGILHHPDHESAWLPET